jgi:hypothetical protein
MEVASILANITLVGFYPRTILLATNLLASSKIQFYSLPTNFHFISSCRKSISLFPNEIQFCSVLVKFNFTRFQQKLFFASSRQNLALLAFSKILNCLFQRNLNLLRPKKIISCMLQAKSSFACFKQNLISVVPSETLLCLLKSILLSSSKL